MIEAPNYQWPEGEDFFEEDRGTLALAVGPAPTPPDPLADVTEDFEDETFNVAISGSWATSATQAHGGLRSLKANTITHSQTTDAVVTVPAGGYTHVRFWYKVSSESNFDFFRFLVGATINFSASGEVGFVQSALIPLAGATTVTFRYTKDSSDSAGSDTAWVDDLVFSQVVENPDGTYKALKVNANDDLLVDPVDDFSDFEAQHTTLVASTDTTITFAQAVRIVRVSNWDASNRILVKNGAIASDSDATAARVGKAPTADVPGQMYFPYAATTIHIRSAAASEITVEGYFGSV